MPDEPRSAGAAPVPPVDRRRPGEHAPHRRAVLVAIGVGGALGGAGRHAVEVALASPGVTTSFPWPTFVVNVTGALILGVVATLVVERWPPTRYVRPFVGVGLLGGYTTWSAFMTDAALLVRDGRPGLALGYMAATLVAGLAATVAGIGLGRRWPATR